MSESEEVTTDHFEASNKCPSAMLHNGRLAPLTNTPRKDSIQKIVTALKKRRRVGSVVGEYPLSV